MEIVRNLSEYALCLTTESWLIIHSKDIDSEDEMEEWQDEISKRCHIYIVNTRPSIFFDPDSIHYDHDNEILSGVVRVKFSDGEKIGTFSISFPLLDGAVRVDCIKANRELVTLNDKNEQIRYVPANLIVEECTFEEKNTLDRIKQLKVEYVGQSYGAGHRSALDRLKSHNTLQKILAKKAHENPDEEVFVSLFSFQEPRIITHMDPRRVTNIDNSLEDRRWRDIFDNPLSKKEQISLIEAGLIRYFQPEYNKIFKTKFPSKKHKLLSEMNILDISGLIVEISPSDTGFSLYSDSIVRSSTHFAQFDLSNKNDRKGFFHSTLRFFDDSLIRKED